MSEYPIDYESGDVPTADADGHVYGTLAGPLLTSEGRGVRGGRPYGEQLHTEAEEMHAMYALRPAAYARLRAATRAALGR